MHTADQLQFWRINYSTCWIAYEAVLHIRVNNLAHDYRLIWPKRQRRQETALKATGLALTRGGVTFIDGAVLSFASSNSFVPGGASMQVMFIASATSSDTRLMTNSFVARMLVYPSIVHPGEPKQKSLRPQGRAPLH
jgi:hypothetical protein